MQKYNVSNLADLLDVLDERNYRFITATPTTHACVNARKGNDWAHDVYGILGWSRPFNPEIVDEQLFGLMQAAGILSEVDGGWRSQLRVSSINEQLFLHSAFPTTATDAVFFGPDTYRFANALQWHLTLHQEAVKRAIDIGTGSGAGAILLSLALPEAEVYGVDINDAALILAEANGQHAGTDNLQWQHSDLLNDVDGEFDLIVANPPYLVDASERSYRHGGGLLGAEFSLDIVEAAITRLAPGGRLLLYTGAAIVDGHDLFLEKATHRLQEAGMDFHYVEMDPDIFSEELASPPYDVADRIAAVVLTAEKSR